jgi:hypothetical protein
VVYEKMPLASATIEAISHEVLIIARHTRDTILLNSTPDISSFRVSMSREIEATARFSPMTRAFRPRQGRCAAGFHKWRADRPLLRAFPYDNRCFSVADLMPLGNPAASRCHR